MAPGGGSGLSLARFSSGKLRTTKPLDQEKKRLEKTIQYRRYNVDLKREKKKRIEDAAKPNRPTFYDKVFQQSDESVPVEPAEEEESEERKKKTHRPDRFFKAKKKQEEMKRQREESRKEREEREKKENKQIKKRKHRHIKMCQRTRHGQPLLNVRMESILSKLEKK